jgi:hypothetical protein
MSLDDLLNAANQLSETDLETLVDQILLLRARRKAPVLPSQESSLLLQINHSLPADLHQRYYTLTEKRDSETLTNPEYDELLNLSDRFEQLAALRVEALVSLAALRHIPLAQLMDDLGIQPPMYA